MPSRPSFGATDVGLLLMALIWGVNFSVVKAGIRTLEPFAFNGLRVALAAVVLGALSWFTRADRWPSRRDVVHLALLGLVGNGLYQLFFILGMARTRAGIAALVMAAGPAYIAIISHLLGRERLPVRAWAGIGMQLTGVACVVASTHGLDAGTNSMLGAGMIACGSLMWAMFSVMLQPYTTRAHPFHLSSITMASGAAFLLVVATPALRRLDVAGVVPSEWGAVAYAGIGALVIAYLLFYRGVRVLGPTRTAMYGNLQPLIAIAVAWLMLSERPTGWQLLGASLITGGLLLSRTAASRPIPRPLSPSSVRS
ncbi:MAG: EamA family transporter [Gemmatimonadaceae bacterium]|nr:EamA family transporter [Gemmatimonadaceae bacterium]